MVVNKAREVILKLLEVFVLKFKSIAKYQVTHLLENANNNTPTANNNTANVGKETSSEKTNEAAKIVNEPMSTSQLDLSNANTEQKEKDDKKTRTEKLDQFINSYEEKDRIKVSFVNPHLLITAHRELQKLDFGWKF